MEAWYEKTNDTWGNALDRLAEEFPANVAIIFQGKEVAYQELRDHANRLAKGLIQCGVQKGETVAIWMTNCLEWIYAQYSIYKIGAVMLPVYTRWKTAEVQYSLKQSDASTLFMMNRFLGAVDAAEMFEQLCPEITDCDPGNLRSTNLPQLRRVIVLDEPRHQGMYSFAEIMTSGTSPELDDKLRAHQASVDPFDVMNIMYTSGTTGFPKGGLSMHRNNMASIYNIGVRMELTETDRLLVDLPLFSNFGCMFSLGVGLLRGCSAVLNETFEPEQSLLTIRDYKVNFVFGSPTMFVMMLDQLGKGSYDLHSLKGGLVGGASVPPEVMKGIIHRMGAKGMLSIYGLSECGGAATTSLAGDSEELRSSTVGTPLPNVDLRVADPESGEAVSPGEQGEIWLTDVYPGSCVGQGYYKMPDKTAETITKDGWFRTGDLGVLGQDGYLRFTGRLKDMLLVGGFNVEQRSSD
jgi:fatty-acyl-CoA synthase